MMLHHGKHHASYVEKLNTALEKFPELQGRTAIWLLLNLSKVPKEIRTTVRQNAGGHVNHGLLWRAMSPAGAGAPAGALADAIRRDFGSVEKLKARFAEVGEQRFGSGWVWLARTHLEGGRLQVLSTFGHENPMLQGHYPILVNDVWEDAYYLKYETGERIISKAGGRWQTGRGRRYSARPCPPQRDRYDPHRPRRDGCWCSAPHAPVATVHFLIEETPDKWHYAT